MQACLTVVAERAHSMCRGRESELKMAGLFKPVIVHRHRNHQNSYPIVEAKGTNVTR